MSLTVYRKKRNLTRSPEPGGRRRRSLGVLHFVVQKHVSRRMHFDLRLELSGVFKSWAVPKGPSMNPQDKRLAVEVDDHPLEYRKFEGRIPEGSYGAGDVEIWDHGTYHSSETADPRKSEELFRKGFKKGHLDFVLKGERFRGGFALIRTKMGGERNWLLIKHRDAFIKTGISAEQKEYDKVHAEHEAARMAKKKPRDPAAAVEPMLAHLVKEPFSRRGWLFEIKWDGYRAVAEVAHGNVRLYSRNGVSFQGKYPPVESDLATLKLQAVFDGEVVVLDEQGRSRFHLLQQYLRTGQGNPQYQVFDLLELNGKDLRNYPLFERKQLLEKTVSGLSNVHYCDHVVEKGKEFLEEALKQGLEGVMAKRIKSLYHEGKRSWDWMKVKVPREQEAVICGFTAPKGSRQYFGSLVLGVYDGKELVYAGQCGAGFRVELLQELKRKFDATVLTAAPFSKLPEISQGVVTWIKPKLVCKVLFTERTEEGLFRHPVFGGLLEGKNPRKVVWREPLRQPA